MLVKASGTVIIQMQVDMRNAEQGGLTVRKLENTIEAMLNIFGDSLSDVATSDDEEDGEGDDEDEEDLKLGKLSEVEKPSWLMGITTRIVQQRKMCFSRSR